MRCVILYGGVSAEHDITLRSCHFILQKMNPSWDPLLVGITKSGDWYLQDFQEKQKELVDGDQLSISTKTPTNPQEVFLSPENLVVWPMLHGPYGEDGKIQGLLESYKVAYVGSDVLGSSLAMHKPLAKIVAQAVGASVGPFHYFKKSVWVNDKRGCLGSLENMTLPLYVKPVAMGSSIGISRVDKFEDLEEAIKIAFLYDSECIIEEEIIGREIEVAVLGGEKHIVSEPGEILKENAFYDYKEKYSQTSKAKTEIPAKLEPSTTNQLKQMALQIFQSLNLYGLSRMDFFVTKDQKIYFNEANTMPGFTSISLYPRLMEHVGLAPSKLIDELLKLAIKRNETTKPIQT